MSVGHKLVRATRMGRKGINTTAKHLKQMQIRLSASTELKRGCLLIAMHSDIVEAKLMMEGIWPKLGRQISTTKNGM